METPNIKISKTNSGSFVSENKEYSYILTPNDIFSLEIIFEAMNLKEEILTFEVMGVYHYLNEVHKLYMTPILMDLKRGYKRGDSYVFKLKIKLPTNIPPSITCLNIRVEYFFKITNIKYKRKFIIKELFIIKNDNKCDTIRADKILKPEYIQLVSYNEDIEIENNEITWLISKLRDGKTIKPIVLIKDFFDKQKEYIKSHKHCIDLVVPNNTYKPLGVNVKADLVLDSKISDENTNKEKINKEKIGCIKNIKLLSEKGSIEIGYHSKLKTNNLISLFYNYDVKNTRIQFLKIEKSWQEEIKEVLQELSYFSENMIRKNLEISCRNISIFENDEISIKYGINFIFDDMEKLILFE